MTDKKKVLAWAYLIVLMLPALLAFSDTCSATICYAATLYGVVLYLFRKDIFPQWMREYYKRLGK